MIEKKLKNIKGFIGNSINCGIKYKNLDLSLIYSKYPCVAAGAFTKNLVTAAPVIISKNHIKNNIQAIIINSGNANAATGTQGLQNANEMCNVVGTILKIKKEQVLVSSTGIIGKQMPMDKIVPGILDVSLQLSQENFDKIPAGIKTTDTFEKYGSVQFEIDGEMITINGMAKGSGMIHPNMATMLSFLTTDINISKELLQEALSDVVEDTFNMISVDGDTSTNDMVLMLSNKTASNEKIIKKNKNYEIFKKELYDLMEYLSIEIAKDGEGATKLLEVNLFNAGSKQDAKVLSKAIITSSLVKSAFFGEDANWGRILSSMGASGSFINPDKVTLLFSSKSGKITLMQDGKLLDFSEEKASEILKESHIIITIDLNEGFENAKAWGCDLTYDYIKINADYRT